MCFCKFFRGKIILGDKVIFEDKGDGFRVTLKRNEPDTDMTYNNSRGRISVNSEKSSEKIIKLMKQNKNITISDIAKRLNISTRAVEKQIAKLKKQNIIKRIGPDKGGYWEVH